MSATYESVLNEARKLGEKERAKLVSALTPPATRRVKKPKTSKGNQVISTLRDWVDEMEKTKNPKRGSAAKAAERIRKQNDRGYKI